MNFLNYKLSLIGGTALMFLTALPLEATNQITGVELQSKSKGVELNLDLAEAEDASYFTVQKGNQLEVNFIDTQLKAKTGKKYSQFKPHPEIASVKVSQQKNSIKVVVEGEETAPVGNIVQPNQKDITLQLKPGTELAQVPTFSENKQPVVQQQETEPEVMFPNPEVIIENEIPGGENTPAITPSSTPPTYLPQATPPPVGDIAVSNINTNPATIDLGTGGSISIPRLVLKDAPAADVLNLLAQQAGLSVVYVNSSGGEGEEAGTGPKITLDLVNQSVGEVFNSVLLISNLNANRRGNTVFVGENLPAQARNVVSRTLRLNQVKAQNAAAFLANQGAEVQLYFDPGQERVIDENTGTSYIRNAPPELVPLTVENVEQNEKNRGAYLLQGLTASTDERLNSITLIGEPNKVQLATTLLTQLDARRPQVAINVKVIDVNLLGTEAFNSSFSFGIGDSFFVQDNGAAIANFGGANPPSAVDTTNSVLTPTVIPFPYEGEPFLEQNPEAPFGYNSSTVFDSVSGAEFNVPYTRAPFGTEDNPIQPGVTQISGDQIEFSLPQLFQYPQRFLSTLQARITSGNAKILTDPTLVVQEGQAASVKLTQEVVGNIVSETVSTDGLVTRTVTADIEEAGLILTINVERIDDNGFISFAVSPQVTSIGGVQQLEIGGDGNQIALLNVRELQSGLIRIRDGQTLILSGIIQDADRVSVSKVPVLGDLPIIGALFRSTDRDKQRNEVIVLVTPQIVDEQADFGYNYMPGKEAMETLQQQGYPFGR